MILYLGGYHNTVRRRLLKSIYDIFPEAEYRHFGDIDAGGFEIYRSGRIRWIRNFVDIQEVRQTFKGNDRRRLERIMETMKDDECYAEISEVI